MYKQELRKQMLSRRRMVSAEEQQAASAVICGKLLDLLREHPDGAVLSYLAYGREVDLSALHRELWRQGRKLLVPVTDGLPAGEMAAVEYTPHTKLAKTRLGVAEPQGVPHIDPREIGVVLAPGVAFDERGGRLGHGMGYYDRYLPQVSAAVWGVCYHWQLVDAVPQGPFDRAMDLVVTD